MLRVAERCRPVRHAPSRPALGAASTTGAKLYSARQANARLTPEPVPTLRFRAIWISDTHLGTPGCQAARLLDFLRRTESDYLYLVGDIIDGWQLRRRWYWQQSHNDVVQKIL